MRTLQNGRFFDIDGMLFEDALWLATKTGMSVKDFLEIANKIELRQEDWDRFWKIVRTKQTEEKIYDCTVLGNVWELNEDEFKFVIQLLGEPEEVSNCCMEDVIFNKCSECKEGCGVIYVWH
jgi:hypothetical protein